MPAPKTVPAVLLFALAVFAGCQATGSGTSSSGAAASGNRSTPSAAAPASTAAAPAPALGARKSRLVVALADANRVNIAPTAVPGAATPTARDLRGQYNVAEFLELLEFDEAHGLFVCEGTPDAVFTIQRNDETVATLRLFRLNYLRWEGGGWQGDALLKADSALALLQWCLQASADIRPAITQLINAQNARSLEASRAMLAGFSGEALDVFRSADRVVYQGRQTRWVTTRLPEIIAEPGTLAETAFRALAVRNLSWLEEDWATGALVTSVLEMDPTVVEPVMERLFAADTARLGIARVFFRAGLWEKLPAPSRDRWIGRLADAALRTAPDRDKPAILEIVAEIPGAAATGFLREIASGSRTYAYTPPYDEVSPLIEEPSIRATALLHLARRGDASASMLGSFSPARTAGPDQAAIELARTFLGTGRVTPTHLSYRSRTLGRAAVESLARQGTATLTLDLLAAAVGHFDVEVAGAASRLARTSGLQPSDGETPLEPKDFVDPMMATTHPRRAIELATASMSKAAGRALAQLHAIRGEAHSTLRDYQSAAVDFLEAERLGYAKDLGTRRRLVWTQWYLGDFEDAEETIARALGEEPTSEFLLLRGLLHYTQSDFGGATEADLIAAMVMDPSDDYPSLFHHLVANLGGRPELSRIRTQISAPLTGDIWPRHIMDYLLGRITAERLVELAGDNDPAIAGWHTCEANFYIAQAARIAGREEEERLYLTIAVSLDQPHVAEYWLAKYRLEELGGGTAPVDPPPPGVRPPGPRPAPPTERPTTRPPAI